MSAVHAAVGVSVLGLNLLAGGWGAVAWLRRAPSVWFWYMLRAAQATVIVQVVLGTVLLAQGREAADDLHIVYGGLPLLVTLVSEGMRVGAAQHELDAIEDVDSLDAGEQRAVARRIVLREMGIMAVGAILIFTLALRAAAVSGGLF